MSKIIKVAFVGTSCTGKTTLLDICQAKLPDAIIVEEADREWLRENPDVKDRFSVPAQAAVQVIAVKKEKQAHELAAQSGKKSSVIVCDRSVLDPAAYLYALGKTSGAEKLYFAVEPLLAAYDKLYLLDPRDVPYEMDDFRTEDEATRQRFHEGFIKFFELHKVAYELLSGDNATRLAKVKNFIASRA